MTNKLKRKLEAAGLTLADVPADRLYLFDDDDLDGVVDEITDLIRDRGVSDVVEVILRRVLIHVQAEGGN